jgi:hemerythrin
MPIMEWSDDLSVKIPTIDEQHKKLIALLNELHDAMKAKQGKQALGTILTELSNYAVYHFQFEEMYMKKFSYSDYTTHKAMHDAFIKKVTAFKNDFDHDRLGVSLDVMNFLRDWVSTHIKGTDKRYVETFTKNGVR